MDYAAIHAVGLFVLQRILDGFPNRLPVFGVNGREAFVKASGPARLNAEDAAHLDGPRCLVLGEVPVPVAHVCDALRLGERRLALAQRLLRPFALGDVAEISDEAVGLARRVELRNVSPLEELGLALRVLQRRLQLKRLARLHYLPLDGGELFGILLSEDVPVGLPNHVRLSEAELRIDDKTVAQIAVLHEDVIRGVGSDGAEARLALAQCRVRPLALGDVATVEIGVAGSNNRRN